MIKTESMTINGREFVRTYSDAGYMIEREGIRYEEAIDPADTGRTYTETDEPCPNQMTEVEQKAAAYDILVGATE